MVDIHSHILPKMDDGSQSAEESMQLLHLLKAQGVDTVAATPHFYAWENSPEEFLQRRMRAWERLQPVLTEDSPHILLGAEVRYFRGISRIERLHDLCLGGTNVLLLEMPFSSWPAPTVDELNELVQREDITVVLAHIERYLADQPCVLWSRLRRSGALLQCNATFFLGWSTRRKAIKMLRDGEISLIGSDCHGIEHRPPQMDAAMATIRSHAGDEALARLENTARHLIAPSNRVP